MTGAEIPNRRESQIFLRLKNIVDVIRDARDDGGRPPFSPIPLGIHVCTSYSVGVIVMRNSRAVLVRACAVLVAFSALTVVPMGCGDEKAKEAGNAAVPPAITKANNQMENFAKSQPKK
jgi:hypothetical protein